MIVDSVYTPAPNAAVALTSTMVPNPNTTNGWYGSQINQESSRKALAAAYRREGRACDISCMTAVSLSVLERKEFQDYSGNNVTPQRLLRPHLRAEPAPTCNRLRESRPMIPEKCPRLRGGISHASTE